MEQPTTAANWVPERICGYPIASVLSAERDTYLAIGEAGRGVVLKRVDPECLLDGSLHPSIRDRLARVREVAHRGVANLHGVAKERDLAYAIWEYSEGVPFDQYALAPGRSPRELAMAARELALAVASLHLQGIVHGALVSGNILVSPSGSVRLTHVSPLLYNDPTVDVTSIRGLLHYVLAHREELHSPLGKLCLDAEANGLSLRELGTQLAAFIESRPLSTTPSPREKVADSPRRRSLFGAAVVAMVGVGIAGGAWLAVQGPHFDLPRSIHLPSFVGQDR